MIASSALHPLSHPDARGLEASSQTSVPRSRSRAMDSCAGVYGAPGGCREQAAGEHVRRDAGARDHIPTPLSDPRAAREADGQVAGSLPLKGTCRQAGPEPCPRHFHRLGKGRTGRFLISTGTVLSGSA